MTQKNMRDSIYAAVRLFFLITYGGWFTLEAENRLARLISHAIGFPAERLEQAIGELREQEVTDLRSCRAYLSATILLTDFKPDFRKAVCALRDWLQEQTEPVPIYPDCNSWLRNIYADSHPNDRNLLTRAMIAYTGEKWEETRSNLEELSHALPFCDISQRLIAAAAMENHDPETALSAVFRLEMIFRPEDRSWVTCIDETLSHIKQACLETLGENRANEIRAAITESTDKKQRFGFA